MIIVQLLWAERRNLQSWNLSDSIQCHLEWSSLIEHQWWRVMNTKLWWWWCHTSSIMHQLDQSALDSTIISSFHNRDIIWIDNEMLCIIYHEFVALFIIIIIIFWLIYSFKYSRMHWFEYLIHSRSDRF